MDTFATQKDLEDATVGLNSSITQTKSDITLEVSKKVGKDEVCSTISQSAEEILLKGNRVLIESDNFKLDKKGNVTANDANLSGTFKNYSSDGDLGLEINGCNMDFYDWKRNKDYLGTLSSAGTDEQGALSLYCAPGKSLYIGVYKNGIVEPVISFDSNKPNDVPKIKNTWNGTVPLGNGISLIFSSGLLVGWKNT